MTYKKLLYSLDGITLNILTLVNGVLQEVIDLSLNVPILESGLIPARYLPSYVDDIIEGYYYNNVFYEDSAHTQLITGETGKIYVDLSTDLTYRWSGSAYVEVSKSIITGVKGNAESNYRVGNVNITAANIGLANVANIDLSKAIKTITRSGTTFTYTCLDGTTGTFTQLDTIYTLPLAASGTRGGILIGFLQSGKNYPVQLSSEKAYVNVPWTDTTYVNATTSAAGLMSPEDKTKLDGLATVATSGSYNDLTNKPTIGNATLTIQKNGTNVLTFTANATSNKTANITVPTKTSEITNDSNFAVDASYVHTDNNYTTTEKNKLSGIAAGAEVNQNAFSNVKVGSTTVAADTKTDTLQLAAGSNITLTPDATNDKITIAATDTTYESKAAASGGTAVSLVTTGEKYTWNNKSNLTLGTTSTTALKGDTKYAGSSTAGGAATSLENFKVTTTTNLTGDPGINAIGYISGLTKAEWNSQQTDGSLYAQWYSAKWGHEIFGDYRTGLIAVRGKNNGTWLAWRKILDSSNYTDYVNTTNFPGLDKTGTSNLTIGTTATTAAAGNHTHATSIAASTGTNQLSLAANTKYAITAGGTSYVFTTPADTNTHRPILMNGTLILGDNTTALNLKAGSNISLSNSSGTVTIAATMPADDTYVEWGTIDCTLSELLISNNVVVGASGSYYVIVPITSILLTRLVGFYAYCSVSYSASITDFTNAKLTAPLTRTVVDSGKIGSKTITNSVVFKFGTTNPGVVTYVLIYARTIPSSWTS